MTKVYASYTYIDVIHTTKILTIYSQLMEIIDTTKYVSSFSCSIQLIYDKRAESVARYEAGQLASFLGAIALLVTFCQKNASLLA